MSATHYRPATPSPTAKESMAKHIRAALRPALAALLLGAADVSAEVLCGDVNNNGSRTTSDALALLRASVGQEVTLVCEPPAHPLASGQTQALGDASDGAVQAGLAPNFVDNGDGTITDLQSGLVWEKKDRSGGIHDIGNAYTWSTGSGNMDGTVVTEFLAGLNAGVGFAGKTDWRVPSIMELLSLVNYGNTDSTGPATFPEFHSNCAADCTVLACNCTTDSRQWSSTAALAQTSGSYAFGVSFELGSAVLGDRSSDYPVRAVRGGL